MPEVQNLAAIISIVKIKKKILIDPIFV